MNQENHFLEVFTLLMSLKEREIQMEKEKNNITTNNMIWDAKNKSIKQMTNK